MSACCQKKARVTEMESGEMYACVCVRKREGGNSHLLRIVLVYQINVCSYVDADKRVQGRSAGQMDIDSCSVSKWHENRRLFNYNRKVSVEM